MTKQEELFFDKLTENRRPIANGVLANPEFASIKESIVNKYSDQAHFIYELLQNADDVKASKARFILNSNCLIFAHNGKRHFSVSDPDTVEKDQREGRYGDINSITAFGLSTKEKDDKTIGKFGVGFKAVFQYTETPRIYDVGVSFQLNNFIVPERLRHDHDLRKSGETLFEFPFNKKGKSEIESYSDIRKKLENLVLPLLFLKNLKSIEYQAENRRGIYRKTVELERQFDSVSFEKIVLLKEKSALYEVDKVDSEKHTVMLFSEKEEHDLDYSVGFFLENGKLIPSPLNFYAFCYFPTKVQTGLNFIIHAPFILTDSREGIKASDKHNIHMIELLSKLSAKAILLLKEIGEDEGIRLIDDSILSIIPVDVNAFDDKMEELDQISFKPFFDSIKRLFQEEEIIPTSNGYVRRQNAYWASLIDIPKVFGTEQLRIITKNSQAEWVFTSIGREYLQKTKTPLWEFVDSIIRTYISEDNILNGRGLNPNPFSPNTDREKIYGITEELIKAQTNEWLLAFYEWLGKNNKRINSVKKKKIFKNGNGDICAAFDEKNQPILFLPTKTVVDKDKTIDDFFTKDEKTMEFLKSFGFKEPSKKDLIYSNIFPYFSEWDSSKDLYYGFDLIFNYYKNDVSRNEVGDFIKRLKGLNFLAFISKGRVFSEPRSPEELYFPSGELKTYFSNYPAAWFLNIEEYERIAGVSPGELNSFFEELGVNQFPRIKDARFNDCYARTDLVVPSKCTDFKYWKYGSIDGVEENLKTILEEKDKERSVLLWRNLIGALENKRTVLALEGKNPEEYSFNDVFLATCFYFYWTDRSYSYETIASKQLKEKAWLLDRDGEFRRPIDLVLSDLNEKYDVKSEEAKELIRFLGISENSKSKQNEELRKILLQSGFSPKKVELLMETLEKAKNLDDEGLAKLVSTMNSQKAERGSRHLKDENQVDEGDDGESRARKRYKRITNEIVDKYCVDDIDLDSEADTEDDEDEYLPYPAESKDLIRKIEKKAAQDIQDVEKIKKIEEIIKNSEKYSYKWFKTLLEYECYRSKDKLGRGSFSISFFKIRRDEEAQKTLILEHPSKNIPSSIEDLDGLIMKLYFVNNGQKDIALEAVSIRSYTLRVKLKNSKDLEEIDLSKATSADINVKNPDFLLNELKNRFFELGFEDDKNLKKDIPENIRFIFGPPGTGKTTYLAKEELVPLMRSGKDLKILVLTPTNKAADVITNAIMNHSDDYRDWLVRFGTTLDSRIEDEGVFRDKIFDIRKMQKCIMVTTVARFPYDYFIIPGEQLSVRDVKWDYVVFDEASMIPLFSIIYPIYSVKPQYFIVAGDPLQIQPIANSEYAKDLNIYEMVRLRSFSNPKTEPHDYEVKNLNVQYRSIPSIGYVFSSLAYEGKLKHYRRADSQKPIGNIKGLAIRPLNIIYFKTSKYESIYRPKTLGHKSPYQVYSALFVYEFSLFVGKEIARNYPGRKYSIGIISPYRAQADLIEKLVNSEKLPSEIEIRVGTIHGFQGDECDMVFTVFNPPAKISREKKIFLNNKNIINVSVSRARDYLFVVMPDDDTENVDELVTINRVKKDILQSMVHSEFNAHELEKKLFNNEKYIEENTFATSHMSVNVYGLPEREYEIRTEDSAIDVQVHKDKKS